MLPVPSACHQAGNLPLIEDRSHNHPSWPFVSVVESVNGHTGGLPSRPRELGCPPMRHRISFGDGLARAGLTLERFETFVEIFSRPDMSGETLASTRNT